MERSGNEAENSFERNKISSHEQAVTKGANGGKKSGESRRAKKNMREMARLLLDLPLQGDENIKALEQLGVESEDITNQMAVVAKMYQLAVVEGDVRAAAWLRDTAGYDAASMKLSDDKEDEEEDVIVYIPANGREKDIEIVHWEELEHDVVKEKEV